MTSKSGGAMKVTSSKIPKYAPAVTSMTSGKSKRGRRGQSGGIGVSDVDSVVTEDFEDQFHKIMVKQVRVRLFVFVCLFVYPIVSVLLLLSAPVLFPWIRFYF